MLHAKFFCLFLKEEETCNNPPSEKKARYGEPSLIQLTRASVIKFARKVTQDHASSTQLIATEPSDSCVGSMATGRKLKREWATLYNVSAQPTELEPLQVLQRSSDIEVQSEFVSIYIIFFLSLFSKNKTKFSQAHSFLKT